MCENVKLGPFAIGHVPSCSSVLGEGPGPETPGVPQPRPRARAPLVGRGPASALRSPPQLAGGGRASQWLWRPEGQLDFCMLPSPCFSEASAAASAQGAVGVPPPSTVKPLQGLDAGLVVPMVSCLEKTSAVREGGPEGPPLDFQS